MSEEERKRKLLWKQAAEALEAQADNIGDLPESDKVSEFGDLETAEEIQERLRKLAKTFLKGE